MNWNGPNKMKKTKKFTIRFDQDQWVCDEQGDRGPKRNQRRKQVLVAQVVAELKYGWDRYDRPSTLVIKKKDGQIQERRIFGETKTSSAV